MKEQVFVSLAKPIITGIFIVVGAVLLSNTGFVIKNLGSTFQYEGKIVNTISTNGTGKIYGIPDLAVLNFSLSKTEESSALAISKVNEGFEQAIKKIKELGIEDKDIKTVGFDVFTEYDYLPNGGSVVKGQRASMTVEVRIRNLDEKATKASKVIDAISVVKDIQISGMYFDIENKKELASKARELALKDARNKAEELAKLSGTKIIGPVQITDNSYFDTPIYPPIPMANYRSIDEMGDYNKQNDMIFSGQLVVNVDVFTIWGIE